MSPFPARFLPQALLTLVSARRQLNGLPNDL
jgi:hypothetical protein